jgi:MFS family permease
MDLNHPQRTGLLASPAETSWRYRGWLVAVAAMVGLMFGPSTIAILSFGVFIHPLEAAFGWSRPEVAIASTIVSYTAMVIAPLQGYLVDRYGARPVILPCVPLFALAVGAMYFLPAVHWLYYLAWIVLPVVGIGVFPLSYVRVVSSWFDKKLGLAIGIANAGIGIGNAVLPLIVNRLIRDHGWRVGFLGMAVLALIVTFPAVFFLIKEKPGTATHTRARTQADKQDFRLAVSSRRFRLMAVIFVLLGLVSTALVVHQIPLLIDAGLTPQRAALVQATFGIFVIVGRVATGFLIDLLDAPLVMMTWVLGATATCLLYASDITSNLVFLCGALFGMLIGAEFDVLGYLLKRYFGMRSFGKLHGIVFAFFQFGAGAGAALLPFIRQSTGSYREGLFLFAAAMLICVVMLWLLRRTETKR